MSARSKSCSPATTASSWSHCATAKNFHAAASIDTRWNRCGRERSSSRRLASPTSEEKERHERVQIRVSFRAPSCPEPALSLVERVVNPPDRITDYVEFTL